MAKLGRILAVVATILYPVVVMVGLLVFKISPRGIGLAILAIVLVNFFGKRRPGCGQAAAALRPVAACDESANARDADQPTPDFRSATLQGLAVAALSLVLVGLVFITDNPAFVKLYPVIVNAVLLSSFAFSLARPPSAIFRLASLKDPSVLAPDKRPAAEAWCRKVTIVWCCFFLFNGLVALYTTLWAPPLYWAIYNGAVSYVLIGILLLGEIVLRKRKLRS